jgi:hypothetical protein
MVKASLSREHGNQAYRSRLEGWHWSHEWCVDCLSRILGDEAAKF